MKKIILTGNVGRDPELRADQNGNQFVTFSLAVSVGTKQNPKTDWIDISCNGRLVDVAKNYVKKGTKLLVEGFPSVHAYMTRENTPAATMRVSANNFEFLSKKDDEADSQFNSLTGDSSDIHTSSLMTRASTSSMSTSDLDAEQIPF